MKLVSQRPMISLSRKHLIAGGLLILLIIGFGVWQATRAAAAPAPDFTQSAYRWFGNQDSSGGGSASFATEADYPAGGTPSALATADFNNDGIVDIVTISQTGLSVSVLLGNGDGTFGTAKTTSVGVYPAQVATADFDNDGNTDIVFTNYTAAIRVLYGNGDGTFTSSVQSSGSGYLGSITTGDINGDGNMDVITDNASGGGQAVVFLGNGDRTFGAATSFTIGGSYVKLADLNGDGKADLVVTMNTTTDNVNVYLSNGDGTFATPKTSSVSGAPYQVVAADFNGDGKTDLATGGNGTTMISVLLGNGDGTFGTSIDTSAGSTNVTGLLVSADFNNDGRPDIVATLSGANALSVLIGNGDGTFKSPISVTTGGTSVPVVAADFDGNNRGDIAILVSNSVGILLGNDAPVNVDSPLAAQDTAASVTSKDTPLRLRMDVRVDQANAIPKADELKLQVAPRGTDGVCDASFVGETYTDVQATSGPVRYYDNPVATDGTSIVTNANDPVDGSRTLVRQSYQENNTFNVSHTIPSGQDGMWDFALTVPQSTTPGSYCLRTVMADGSPIDAYTVMPEVVVPSPQQTQSNYRWYAASDTATPGVPLAPQNIAATIPVQTSFRLRQLLHQSSGTMSADAAFRLQAAQKVTTCSAANFVNLGDAHDASGFVDGASTIVDNTAAGTVSWVSPSKAAATDDIGAYAIGTAGSTSDTHLLKATGFGFSVPANATITGVEARIIVDDGDTTSSSLKGVILVKNGAIMPSTVQGAGTTLAGTVNVGSSTNLWTTTLTPTDVNSSGFGVALQATLRSSSRTPTLTPSASIDDIAIQVSYIVPNTSGMLFFDTSALSDGSNLSPSALDPTPTSGSVVAQTYNESAELSSQQQVSAGDNGMWGVSLIADTSLNGKTYCFRVVKSDGTLLAGYDQYPEITFGVATAPTLQQELRGGQSVIDGVKKPFRF